MFDPISMSLMGAGAGMSVLSGFMGQDAARDAQAGQLGFLEQAAAQNKIAGANAANLFNSYQLYGSSALNFLQSRILNSTERQMATVQQRSALQAEVDRLSQQVDWRTMPLLTGEKASERRATIWQTQESERLQNLAAAQSRLNSFEREQAALAPLQAEQNKLLEAKQGRIDTAIDRIGNLAPINLPQSLGQLRTEMSNDPIFQFRQETGERAINRAAASRGNFLSGAALASIGDFNNQLTADETERYFNRLLQSETLRFNSSLTGAQAALGAELGMEQQGINNLMGLSQIGLNAASGASNAMLQTNQVGANLTSQMGQAYANTELAKGQAMQQALGGIGQMAGMGVGLSMMSQFTGANVAKPGASAVTNVDPAGLTPFSPMGTNTYIRGPR